MTVPRHVYNALGKAGAKFSELTPEQRERALQADHLKAGLRGKALATWIIDGVGTGEQIEQARAAQGGKAQRSEPLGRVLDAIADTISPIRSMSRTEILAALTEEQWARACADDGKGGRKAIAERVGILEFEHPRRRGVRDPDATALAERAAALAPSFKTPIKAIQARRVMDYHASRGGLALDDATAARLRAFAVDGARGEEVAGIQRAIRTAAADIGDPRLWGRKLGLLLLALHEAQS